MGSLTCGRYLRAPLTVDKERRIRAFGTPSQGYTKLAPDLHSLHSGEQHILAFSTKRVVPVGRFALPHGQSVKRSLTLEAHMDTILRVVWAEAMENV